MNCKIIPLIRLECTYSVIISEYFATSGMEVLSNEKKKAHFNMFKNIYNRYPFNADNFLFACWEKYSFSSLYM